MESWAWILIIAIGVLVAALDWGMIVAAGRGDPREEEQNQCRICGKTIPAGEVLCKECDRGEFEALTDLS